ncbi:MFS transporter [Bacillus sp. 2205SS5-2]|uniref:MFS transporter n=1 Tax=Bacillus sp. 2205SS5-2 TaxID=3109031 RepID=UPI0030073CDB
MGQPIKQQNILDHENKIVLIWSVAVWLVVMNTTMFNVALPTVLQELSLDSSTASWIVSGYSIVFAISTLTYSRLSDYIPISRLLLTGLLLLSFASIIGWQSSTFEVLLFSRLLQAAGAGAVPGLAMVLAGRYIPVSRRGKAMSFISSAASLGFGLGPVIGGAITQAFGWNELFIVTGVVVFLLPLFYRLLPKEETKKIKFDFIGALLTAISVTCLLLFLSTLSIYFFLISMVSVFVLWVHIHKIQIPFIQPSILKKRPYIKLLLIGFVAFVTHFSTLFMMPIMLSVIHEKGAATIGLIIFPGAMLSAIAAQFIGRLIDHFGNKPLMVVGQLLLILSTSLFAFFSSVSPYWIMIAYMFMSTGFSALTSSIANEATRILPKDEIGTGMGMYQLVQFFGGALGVAISGMLIAWQSAYSAEIIYRNNFLGLIGILTLAVGLFILYIRPLKIMQHSS